MKRERNVFVQFHANASFFFYFTLCFIVAFSEDRDDVTLQCPSMKHSIDVKEIKVEDSQVSKLLYRFKYVSARTPQRELLKTIFLLLTYNQDPSKTLLMSAFAFDVGDCTFFRGKWLRFCIMLNTEMLQA